jgi:hypothetical protein
MELLDVCHESFVRLATQVGDDECEDPVLTVRHHALGVVEFSWGMEAGWFALVGDQLFQASPESQAALGTAVECVMTLVGPPLGSRGGYTWEGEIVLQD